MNDDPTIDFYDRNAEVYAAATFGVDAAGLRKRFAAHLPPGGKVLDAGCGSGRDALAFIEAGFAVTAMEPSVNMASVAARNTGLDVVVGRFQEISWENEFDGIWACASLLHVPSEEMADVVLRLSRALRVGGTLYASFKTLERSFSDERLFTAVTSEDWKKLTSEASFTVIDEWTSADQKGREEVRWLNFLSRKG